MNIDFASYWKDLPAAEREPFATRCITSVGHLNNVAYGFRKAAPDLCVRIERESNAAVTRRELRPDAWGDIWPELIDDSHPWRVPSETAK